VPYHKICGEACEKICLEGSNMGRFFGSGDRPVHTVGFAYLEVCPEPFDWRYRKPQSPSFDHGT